MAASPCCWTAGAVRTPAGAKLVVPTAALAGWSSGNGPAQGDEIVMASMPAMRLASTAADKVPGVREAMAEAFARYAASDLLCYFADGPQALVARQVAHWDPVLDWARDDLGLELVRTVGDRPPAPAAGDG
ncbi:MAG: ATP12 family chaperone protein [Caulobacteraceae bacterium]